jgi:hypothetical protein
LIPRPRGLFPQQYWSAHIAAATGRRIRTGCCGNHCTLVRRVKDGKLKRGNYFECDARIELFAPAISQLRTPLRCKGFVLIEASA